MRRGWQEMPEMKISLTSLLDLVFNILAFFVITYKPPLATKSYQVNLPPPNAKNVIADANDPNAFLESDVEPEVFEDITLTLTSGAGGVLTGIRLEGKPIEVSPGQRILERELQVLVGSFRGIGKNLEAVNIAAPADLKYRYLIDVVDVCQRAGFKKINFADAGP